MIRALAAVAAFAIAATVLISAAAFLAAMYALMLGITL